MAINKIKIRGKEVTFIEGPVTAVYINPIPPEQIKTYTGKVGPWTPTHRYNLVVDGTRISLGMGDKDGVSERQKIRVKSSEGDDYHDLTKGLVVSVEAEENGEYKGVKQWQSSTSRVVVTDASGAQKADAPAASGGGAAYKPKDMTGVYVGHATNVAINVLGLADADELIAAAKEAHALTEKLRAEYKQKFPNMSDYDLGASVGQAVLSASSCVESVGDIEHYARITLDSVTPAVRDHIMALSKPAPKPLKEKVTPAKKAAPKKTAKPAPEPEPEPDADPEQGDFTGFDDMDDDIPF